MNTTGLLTCGKTRKRSAKRSGLMTIVALVCLLVVMSLVGSMLKNAMFARRELLTVRDRIQTDFLLQAGVGRAAAHLTANPEFHGDTWELPAELIANNGDGRITTVVTRASNDKAIWDVHVVAEYPLGRGFPIRRSHTFHITSSETQ